MNNVLKRKQTVLNKKKQISQRHYNLTQANNYTQHEQKTWNIKTHLGCKKKRIKFIVVGVYTFADVDKLPLGILKVF